MTTSTDGILHITMVIGISHTGVLYTDGTTPGMQGGTAWGGTVHGIMTVSMLGDTHITDGEDGHRLAYITDMTVHREQEIMQDMVEGSTEAASILLVQAIAIRSTGRLTVHLTGKTTRAIIVHLSVAAVHSTVTTLRHNAKHNASHHSHLAKAVLVVVAVASEAALASVVEAEAAVSVVATVVDSEVADKATSSTRKKM